MPCAPPHPHSLSKHILQSLHTMDSLHIVFLPFPLQGHISPCFSLARLLVAKGLNKCTFVVPQEFAPKLQPSDEDAPIELAIIPSHGDGHTEHLSGLSGVKQAYGVMESMRPAVEDLLSRLASSEHRVSCIIVDSFVTWSPQVSEQFNLPRFAFFTANAHAFALMLHLPLLISKGFVPVRDPKQIIDCLPGIPALPAATLPAAILSKPHAMMAQISMELPKTAGVIFNTAYHLESSPLEVIQKQLPIYPIGPLPLMPGSATPDTKGAVQFWPEERNCLQWLDTMPPSSVLYVSFGSLAFMGMDQMVELADGLEASKQAFLWVIRPNAASGLLTDLLPKGFEDRTRGKGLIITWAPQVEVLSHPAVGGFLTHCGWNSLIESFCMGVVPMICWPHMADQRLNARLVVDEWRIGSELQEEEGGLVKREAVETAVIDLMQGEVGREMRRRALQLKETASIAVQERGTSSKYLEALVQDLKRLASSLPETS